jgi:hypothetical protein
MIMNSFLATLVDRVIDLHNRSLIATPVAVVGSRKHCDDLSIVLPLVSLHNQLMSTGDEMKPIDMSKLLSNVLTESVAGSPR